ncbi:MAG TPA: glycosyltransferase [bacterium]|nr:glycosyltransferase [bacterium]
MSAGPIAVVLSQLNGEAYLAQALESLAAQTLAPQEILLIDGGSTDRSLEIAAGFPSVRVIRQAGRGIPDANNQGIREARCPLIAFLEHDDLWHPRKLELQARRFEFDPGLEYCVTRFEFFREPGAEIPACFKPELFERNHVGRIMSTLMAKKSFFDRVGAFDSSYVSAGDVDWFARAQDEGGRLAVLEEVLVRKRIHRTNFSNLALVNNAEMLRALSRSVARRRAQSSK